MKDKYREMIIKKLKRKVFGTTITLVMTVLFTIVLNLIGF